MIPIPDVAVPADELSVSMIPAGTPDVAAAWAALEGRADPSFFLSWGWIGCWLDSLAPEAEAELVEVRRHGTLVGLGVLVRRTLTRRGVLKSRTLFLHQSGDPAADAIWIEHNGLLCDRTMVAAVEQRVLDWLVERDPEWDELQLPGVPARWAALAAARGLKVWLRSTQPCRQLDLGAVAAAGGLERALGRNTRYQLRRAERHAAQAGALGLVEAETPAQAQAFFAAMKALHIASWQRRGKPHAFTHPLFERFHRRLIDSRFAAGEIQLLRAQAGDAVIGYLYNFRHQGRIYAYQSGFAYQDHPHAKPGLVSHALAIRHNVEQGAHTYDFLAGDNQLKASLSDGASEMVWLTAQRDRLPLRLERSMRELKQGISEALQSNRRRPDPDGQ